MLENLSGPIRANRPRVPEMNPFKRCFFANRVPGHQKIANHGFEAIRANCSNVMKIAVFLRIDSREVIRANRPDSKSESLGHLSLKT